METLTTDLPRTLVSLALVAVLAVVYWQGTANARRAGLEHSLGKPRIAAFAIGLLVLFVALSGPVESAGGSWLIAVVGQQQALVLVAAPLLLLGAPRWAFTLALPASLRRRALSGVGVSGRIAHTVFGPIPTLALYFAATTVWYASPLYDTVLRSSALRALLQVLLLAAALLFWAQVIPSRPARPRLNYVMRALYLGAAGMWSSMIGAFYMFSVAPYYERYVTLARPVGAASALVDQHLAGAVLDVPGVTVFFLGMAALIYLWLREDERQGAALALEPGGGAARVS
jgi:putative membrane protein